MLFQWRPDDPPPVIESHSKAKLEVLRRYLRAYFNRLNVNPVREEFKLDLIDGFAGGGLFLDGTTEVSGTPLIMLEESELASVRLNEKRVKQLHIDCRFYFVDKEKAHTDYLRRLTMTKRKGAAAWKEAAARIAGRIAGDILEPPPFGKRLLHYRMSTESLIDAIFYGQTAFPAKRDNARKSAPVQRLNGHKLGYPAPNERLCIVSGIAVGREIVNALTLKLDPSAGAGQVS